MRAGKISVAGGRCTPPGEYGPLRGTSLAVASHRAARIAKDESEDPYPLSGAARWAVEVDASSRNAGGTDEAHYQATALITFNGTRYPTIEVSESFRYPMDLRTGEIQRLPA
jgi:hypothetical protein